MDNRPILLGSTFPLSLIRRRVVIDPAPLESLRRVLRERPYRSFWGHENTAGHAEALLHASIKPRCSRPALTLDGNGYPILDGETFEECWILSPNYRPGFRPAPGIVVSAEDITGWDVLRMRWE